jgi:hypothetical protein
VWGGGWGGGLCVGGGGSGTGWGEYGDGVAGGGVIASAEGGK